MKKPGLRTITVLLAGLLMLHGVALANGDDGDHHHCGGGHGDSFWHHGGVWVAATALIVTGAILLYRYAGGRGTDHSSAEPLRMSEDAPIRMTVLSGSDLDIGEASREATGHGDPAQERVGLALALRF